MDRRDLWVIAVLLLFTILAYSQVAGFQFINFDDPLYITENAGTLAGLNRGSLRWAFTSFEDGSYLPLVWLSHAACVSLFGTNPAGHHLVNLLLHLANTALLFLVLRRLTGALEASAVVAALFALHPAHVESVAWVSGRKDVLSTLFWLLTTLAYLGYLRSPGWRRYGAMVLIFALGLLSKSMLVTLPLTLLLLDFWPLQRLRAGQATGREGRSRYGQLILEKVPLLALSVAAGSATIWTQGHLDAVTPVRILPLADRFANALLALLAYLRMLVWPVGLSPFYPYQGPHFPIPFLWLAGALLVVISTACMIQFRHRPYLLVGWAWFLLTLLPVAGLVQVGSQAYADRYTYVPFIGLFIMLAWSWKELAERLPIRRSVQLALAAGLSGTLLSLTAVQASRWKDTLTLFAHALSLDPTNRLALGNLGTALAQAGRFPEAIGAYERLVQLSPNYYRFHYILGLLQDRVGQREIALKSLHEAHRLEPSNTEVAYAIGHSLVYQEAWAKALPFIERVFEGPPRLLSKDPRTRIAILQTCRVDQGICLRETGRAPEAIQKLEEAVAMDPASGWPHLQLGVAYRESGRETEAVREIESAFARGGDMAAFNYWLGRSLAKQGRKKEAVEIFSKQLEDPKPTAYRVKIEEQLRHFGAGGSRLKPVE